MCIRDRSHTDCLRTPFLLLRHARCGHKIQVLDRHPTRPLLVRGRDQTVSIPQVRVRPHTVHVSPQSSRKTQMTPGPLVLVSLTIPPRRHPPWRDIQPVSYTHLTLPTIYSV